MSEVGLGEIERLPEFKGFFEVEPGISNEWDAFWLMPENRKVTFFEMSFDFRKKKIRFEIESQNED